MAGHELRRRRGESPPISVGESRRNRRRPSRPPRNRLRTFCTCISARCLLISFSFTVFATLGLVIFANLLNGNFDPDDVMSALNFYKYNSDEMKTSGQILTKCVEVTTNLIKLEQQILGFLMGEPLANLLKQKLQPIQDRVTSLTTQTRQYEGMEHIVGGPTHFITTSLKELDTIEEVMMRALDEEVQIMLKDEALQAILMVDGIRKVLETGHFLTDVMFDPKLLVDDVHIHPTEEVDSRDGGKYVEDLILIHSFEKIIKIYADLIPKMEKRDEIFDQIESLQHELGLDDENDVEAMNVIFNETDPLHFKLKILADEHELWSQRVIDFVDEYYIMLQLLLPHSSTTMNKVADLQEQLLNYTTVKRRGYINLKARLEEDIRNLKVRIQNLRYEYVKIKPASKS